MTCYIDQLSMTVSRVPEARRVGERHGHLWCHLWTDGAPEELHVFAESIGLRRAWYQTHRLVPHYDLVPPRRDAALRAGAVEASLKEFVRRAMGLASPVGK